MATEQLLKKKKKMPEWYKKLVDDCKEIISNEALDIIRRRHEIGLRILKEKKQVPYGKIFEFMKGLAVDIELSWQNLYYCTRFAEKHPNVESFLEKHIGFDHNALLKETVNKFVKDGYTVVKKSFAIARPDCVLTKDGKQVIIEVETCQISQGIQQLLTIQKMLPNAELILAVPSQIAVPYEDMIKSFGIKVMKVFLPGKKTGVTWKHIITNILYERAVNEALEVEKLPGERKLCDLEKALTELLMAINPLKDEMLDCESCGLRKSGWCVVAMAKLDSIGSPKVD